MLGAATAGAGVQSSLMGPHRLRASRLACRSPCADSALAPAVPAASWRSKSEACAALEGFSKPRAWAAGQGLAPPSRGAGSGATHYLVCVSARVWHLYIAGPACAWLQAEHGSAWGSKVATRQHLLQ